MKRTISINILGQLFSVEEDAYQKLDTYLDSVKRHFAANPDRDEIITDIESRIAEQFLQQSGSERIVTSPMVEELIRSMGKVEDFERDADEETYRPAPVRAVKRLLRNPEDRVIAGVASGIAAYFDIDPVIIRILFVISIFAGGGGIIAYVIFWLIMPEAKTASDKLEMRGDPVSLSSVAEKYKTSAVKARKGISGFIAVIFSAAGAVVRVAVPLATRIIGALSLAGFTVLIAVATFAAANLIFNIRSPYIDTPLAHVADGYVYYAAVLLAFALAVIPIVYMWIAALSLATWKNRISGRMSGGLWGIWLAVLVASGVVGLRYGPEYADRIRSLPQYQSAVRSYDFTDFTRLQLHGVDEVHLIQGPGFSVSASGRQIDLDRIGFSQKDGTLTLSQQSLGKICFFCLGRDRLAVQITMPEVNGVSVHGLVSLNADKINAGNFELEMDGSSSARLAADMRSIAVHMSGASQLYVSGTAQELGVRADDRAYFFGRELLAQQATADAVGRSLLNVNAKSSLTVNAAGYAYIVYQGTPQIIRNLHDRADLVSADSVSPEDNNFYPYRNYQIRRPVQPSQP